MNYSNSLLMSTAIGAVSVVTISCSSQQPLTAAQQVYAGKWVASDGTYVQIFLDGGGSAKGAKLSVEGGSTTISGQTLKIAWGPSEQKYQISQEPKEIDGKWVMKLNGITYVKKDSDTAANTAQEASPTKKDSDTAANTTQEASPTKKDSDTAANTTQEASRKKTEGATSSEDQAKGAKSSGDNTAKEESCSKGFVRVTMQDGSTGCEIEGFQAKNAKSSNDNVKSDDEMKQLFKDQIEKNFQGVSVKKVTCPSGFVRRAVQGETIACEADFADNGKTTTVTGTVMKEGEELRWKSRNLILLSNVEKGIRLSKGKFLNPDCHGRFKIAHTGDKFICDAINPVSKKNIKIKVLVKNEDGDVDMHW